MFLRLGIMLVTCGLFSHAALKRIEVVERTDVTGFPYERIMAKAYFAVDPKLEANRIICDIDLAPKNAEGQVEFAADLYVLKPRDPSQGNGTVLFEVSNRGNKGMLTMFNFAASSRDPRNAQELGDAMLLKQGYTLVWLGWQADVPNDVDVLRLYAPFATESGRTITGKVRSEWVLDKKLNVYSLGDRGTHIPYPVSDEASAVLTVTDKPGASPRVIPRADWQFARVQYGKPVPSRDSVYYAAGFEPGKIYDVVYTGQDPTLVGLGPTGVRDLISFLKYENNGIVPLGDSQRFIKRAIGFGTSQSGRFLRTFLYYGFNQDEKGRKVFDGIWAHVAGAGRGSFNHRFAQPSRDGHPMLNLFYPTDIFPFTDLEQTDDGVTDGLLKRAIADKVAPKIFYTNGSYEYWGRAASLIHTSADGKRDAEQPADTRIYYITGTQHGPGNFPPRVNNTKHPANPNDYRFAMRGLLSAMNSWLVDGKTPPVSAYPHVGKDDLVAPGAVQFPKMKGAELPNWQMAWRADYGPDFKTKGLVTKEPAQLGKPFAVTVPQVDLDGNEKAGIRLPDVEVPLGTFTGWNLRSAEIGNPSEFNNMVGSFFQFAKTKADRSKAGDPRPSLEERYHSREEYLGKVRESANKLAGAGYILAADVPLLEQRAAGQWDYAQKR